MTQFFRFVHERKNESFWPKKSIIGRTKIWPKFLGQNDSVFSLSALKEKMIHFDPKKFITGGTKIWPKKIQSLAEQKFDPNF